MSKGWRRSARADLQSTSGGWWYEPGSPHLHEGSTTCCAVQALVSAHNYGHFYGLMGMRLLGQEFTPFQPKIDAYAKAALRDLAAWQQEDGAWPVRGWIAQNGQPGSYATAFAALVFSIGDGRLLASLAAITARKGLRSQPRAL